MTEGTTLVIQIENSLQLFDYIYTSNNLLQAVQLKEAQYNVRIDFYFIAEKIPTSGGGRWRKRIVRTGNHYIQPYQNNSAFSEERTTTMRSIAIRNRDKRRLHDTAPTSSCFRRTAPKNFTTMLWEVERIRSGVQTIQDNLVWTKDHIWLTKWRIGAEFNHLHEILHRSLVCICGH